MMHSISFRQDTASARARAHEARVRISRAQPGDIVDLGDLVPEAINVEVEISDTAATDWPRGGSLINPTINRAAKTGTVVVPILHDHEDTVKTDRCGIFWEGGDIKYKCHALEVGFAITFHKLQGRTVPKLILDLRERPGRNKGSIPVTFEGLYVGWTHRYKGDTIHW